MDIPKIVKDVPAPNLVFASDKRSVNVRYPLIIPYAGAHIFFNSRNGELIYEIEEPVLDDQDKNSLKKINDAIKETININISKEQGSESIEEYLNKIIKLIMSETRVKISEQAYYKIFYYVYRNFSGLNEIEAMMQDPFIEDIQCNGVGQPIYIVHRVFRNIRTSVVFNDIESLASFVEKLAQKCGKYISYANPILDGSLPDGSRVNATYSKDITSRGPTFTIRKFTKVPFTPLNLVGFGTLSVEMLVFLWMLMQYKLNVLIAGGTGSGKTTMLNGIAFFIPPEARVVSIEDTREISLNRENWLPSVVRSGMSSGGAGEVDMYSLLRASFRQIPDYVIVGEVRGEEASVLFQGMASGHSSMATIHADSVETVIRRLETPPINLSPSLVNELDAVVIMTHAIVDGKESRKLREIVEVIDVSPGGTAKTNTPFMWNPSKNNFLFKKDSRIFEKIQKKHGIPIDKLYSDFDKRIKLIYEMYNRKINSFGEIQRIINDFYKNPNDVYSRFGIS